MHFDPDGKMLGMAKSFLIRFVGLWLVLFTSASLLLTGFVLLQSWRMKGQVTTSLQAGLDVVSSTITTTSNSLGAINQSLEATSGSLKSLQDTAQSAAGSIHSQAASIQSLSTLFSVDLPAAMTGAQTAMIGAQAGAKQVEDTLTVLTSNPAFAATPYQPAIPLSTALSGVAAGLGALPAPMQTAGGKLSTTSGDLTTLESSVTNFVASLDALRTKLEDARKTIGRYQEEVDKLSGRIARLRAGLPRWITGAAWAITFLLGWLGILQFCVLGRCFRWMVRGG
jgi:peptidoglycan hydrolase CwlO-like protein